MDRKQEDHSHRQLPGVDCKFDISSRDKNGVGLNFDIHLSLRADCADFGDYWD